VTTETVLVVGCQEGSLGEAIVDAAKEEGYHTVTAGISGEEDYSLDVVNSLSIPFWDIFREIKPKHVVCTVGINTPEVVGCDPMHWYQMHFSVNVIGPMRLLQYFSNWVAEEIDLEDEIGRREYRHFVAISSNSATIPRSQSAAYCASKAALSQALRVKAREANGGDRGFLVYGYEPGWLADTPMSHMIESRFGPGKAMHRMRGQGLAAGIVTLTLASQIVAGLALPGAGLNGALIRYDGGEV
jgi:NAD(P)-dependent dehydrogenase (short-subunit alcohol dehydrogenase family)